MLDPDVFRVRPLATIGDEKAEVIYMAVGKSLSRWEAAEIRIAHLFAILLAVPTPINALRAYGALAAFNVRQQMVIAAADSFFHQHPNDGLHKKVKTLLSRTLQDASARRGEIAHGIVISTNPTRRRINHFLAPNYYATKKRSQTSEPHYLYSSIEISELSVGFENLSLFIHDVVNEVFEHSSSQKIRSAIHSP